YGSDDSIKRTIANRARNLTLDRAASRTVRCLLRMHCSFRQRRQPAEGFWSRRRESNPHEAKLRQILSLLRLPVPPLRAATGKSSTLGGAAQGFHRPPLTSTGLGVARALPCTTRSAGAPSFPGQTNGLPRIVWPALLPFPLELAQSTEG